MVCFLVMVSIPWNVEMTRQPRDERKLMPAIGELNCLAVVGLFSSVMDSTSFLPKSAHKRYLVDNGQGCIHTSM